MGLDLRFLSKNDHKFEEFRQLFVGTAYTIAKALSSIEEIQTEDMEALVADKVIKAFDKFVVQSSLTIRGFSWSHWMVSLAD
jgi:hypothetical protein